MRFLTSSLLLFSPLFSFAQFASEEVINISADNGLIVKTADMDYDGDQDVIGALGSGILLFKNDGAGLMSTPVVIRKETCQVLEVADFDGDNITDIVCGSEGYVHFYHNDGNGNFVATTNVINVASDNFNNIVAADMDLDGDNDLVISSMQDYISWFENNGNGTFSNEHFIVSAWNPTSLVVSDIDNDGDQDVVYSLNSYDDVFWIDNTGNGVFGSAILLTSYLSDADGVYVSDLDNDGDKDILSASRSDSKITWFQNNGGIFSSPIVISNTANYARAVTTTDVDNDGDQDVLYGGEPQAGWFENLGGGTFGPQIIIADSTGYVRNIVTADLNNDSYTDLISIAPMNWAQVLSYMNNAGTFSDRKNILTAANGFQSFAQIDFDGDNDIDILTASYSDRKIALHENLGGGHFTPQRTITLLTNGPRTVKSADMDGDQLPDIIVASSSDDRITWMKNYGSSFSAPQLIAGSLTGIQNFDIGDLDNDGDVDVAAAYESLNMYIWFENLGNGTFSALKFISASGAVDGPREICVADVDGDGVKDVIGGSVNDTKILWYKKNGTSWIKYNISVAVAHEVVALLAADLDNDGDNDVISCSYNDSELNWYENLGGGVFNNRILINNQLTQLRDGAVADLDLDGDIDILTASNSFDGNGICWFENFGNGHFVKRLLLSTSNLTTGYLPFYGVLAADFDNDGDQEVLLEEGTNDKISFLRNSYLSTFQGRGNFYIDANQNGQRDSLEKGFHLPQITSSPGNLSEYTFDNGRYEINFDSSITANYEVSPTGYNHWGLTSDSLSYHVSVDPSFLFEDSLDFGFYPTDSLDSLIPDINGEFPRCNSLINYWLSVSNQGTTIPSGLIHFTLDTNITYVDATVLPDSIVDNNYYWHYDSLDWFDTKHIRLQVILPNFTLINQNLTSYLAVHTLDTSGVSIYSMHDTLTQVLVCAYDPNDKTAEPLGFGPKGYILPTTQYIDYTIRFQNTGTDTAITVVIRDQLDTNFIYNSLQLLAHSHPVETYKNPNGEVLFDFNNIMLPDSSSSESESHGFVKYRIWLKPGLHIGDSLKNTANIYFDYNPAIVTNTTLHTLYECTG